MTLPFPIGACLVAGMLLFIAAPDASALGQDRSFDIIEISKRMVALQRAGHYATALPWAERALALSE